MFKLLIAALTSLSLMFGGTEIVPTQPDGPIDNAQEWSAQSWTRSQQQERSADVLPVEEALQTRTRDMIHDQTQDQLCDPTVDTQCIPIQDQLQDQIQDQLQDQTQDQLQDQTQDQTQDQLHLQQDATTEPLHLNPNSGHGYGDGDGTCDSDCVPATEPGQHGNGH